MSSIGNLIPFSRHVLAHSTSIHQRPAAVACVRLHAQLDRYYIHSSTKHRASAELKSSLDAVQHGCSYSWIDTGARQISETTDSTKKPEQSIDISTSRTSESSEVEEDSRVFDHVQTSFVKPRQYIVRHSKLGQKQITKHWSTLCAIIETERLRREISNVLNDCHQEDPGSAREHVSMVTRKLAKIEYQLALLYPPVRNFDARKYFSDLMRILKEPPIPPSSYSREFLKSSQQDGPHRVSPFELGCSLKAINETLKGVYSYMAVQDSSSAASDSLESHESSSEVADTMHTTDSVLATTSRSDSPSSYSRARGRSCLVTGATSGIGYETAKRLALEGATHIRIISRDLTRGEKTLERIKQETGRGDLHTEVFTADLTSLDNRECAKMFKVVPDEWPRIDTAILCAGISQSSLAIQTNENDMDQIIKANLTSSILLSKAFLSTYQKTSRPKATEEGPSTTEDSTSSSSRNGSSFCLISVSSLLAHKGGYGASIYAASKLGLTGFNRALTLEAGAIYRRKAQNWPEAPSFRINTVSPGYIDTPMTEGITGEGRDALVDQIPLGRFGKAEEVADAVMFLIGNKYANNCEINLDGGLSAI